MVLHSLRVHEIIPSIRSKHFSFTAVTYQANIYVNRISTILIRIVVILKKQRNIIKDVMIYWSWCKNIFSYMNDIINDIIIRIKILRIFEYLSKIGNFKEEQSENFSFISFFKRNFNFQKTLKTRFDREIWKFDLPRERDLKTRKFHSNSGKFKVSLCANFIKHHIDRNYFNIYV